MQYFVWMRTPKGPMPQIWDEDHTLNQCTGKELASKVIAKHPLCTKDTKIEITGLTLEECAKLLPCPDMNNDRP